MANRYGPLVLKKLAKAQEILGYEFHDISWLREGLDITKPAGHIHAKNKRLALVGDHKIASVFIDRWYGKSDLFSVDWSEIRAANFSNQKFTEISYRNGLSDCTIPDAMLRLPGGKIPDSAVRIMSDTLEALLGAIYTDAKDHNHPDPHGEVEKAALRLGLADRRLMTPEELRWSVENLRTQRKLPPRMFTGHQLALASAIHDLDRPLPPPHPWDSQIHSLVNSRVLEYMQAALVLPEPLWAKARQARLRLPTLDLPKLEPLQARFRLHALGLQKLRPRLLLEPLWKRPANLRLCLHAATRVFADPFVLAYASIKTAFTPVPRHLATKTRPWGVINLTLSKKAKGSPTWHKIFLLSVKSRGDYSRAHKRYWQAWRNCRNRASSIRFNIGNSRQKLRDAVTQRINRLVALKSKITTRVSIAKANLRIGVAKKVKKSIKAKNRAFHGWRMLKQYPRRITKRIRKSLQFKARVARYRTTISSRLLRLKRLPRLPRLPRLFQRQAQVTPVATKAIQELQPHTKISKELEGMASPSVLPARAVEPMESKQISEDLSPTDNKVALSELNQISKKREEEVDLATLETKNGREREEDMKEYQRQMQQEADMTMRLIGLPSLHQSPDPHETSYEDFMQTLEEEVKIAETRSEKLARSQQKDRLKKQAKALLKQEHRQGKKEAKKSAQKSWVKQLEEEYRADLLGPQGQSVHLTEKERRFQALQASLSSLAEQESSPLKRLQDNEIEQPEIDTEQIQLEAGKEVKSVQDNSMKPLDGEIKTIQHEKASIVQEAEESSQVQPQRTIPVQAGEEVGTLAQAEEQRPQQMGEPAMRFVDDANLHVTSTNDTSSEDEHTARLSFEPPPPLTPSPPSAASPAASPEASKQVAEVNSISTIQPQPQIASSEQKTTLNKDILQALIKQRAVALRARDPTLTPAVSRSVVRAAMKTELTLFREWERAQSTKAQKGSRNARGRGVMSPPSAPDQDSEQQKHREVASRVREVLASGR